MFSYFEPNFIEKFFWENGFGHMTIFAKWKLVKLGCHFETVSVFDFFFFAD